MPYYRNIGNVPPKRHTQHRDESGKLYYEELMGEEGFSSSSSLLYHRNHPSSVGRARAWEAVSYTHLDVYKRQGRWRWRSTSGL